MAESVIIQTFCKATRPVGLHEPLLPSDAIVRYLYGPGELKVWTWWAGGLAPACVTDPDTTYSVCAMWSGNKGSQQCINVSGNANVNILAIALLLMSSSEVLLSLTVQSRQHCVNSQWLSQWEGSIFDPPQNPLTDRQKIARVITSTTFTAVQNLLEIRPWGLLGK